MNKYWPHTVPKHGWGKIYYHIWRQIFKCEEVLWSEWSPLPAKREFEGWPHTDQLHSFASLLAFSIDFGIEIVRSGWAALSGAKAVHRKNLSKLPTPKMPCSQQQIPFENSDFCSLFSCLRYVITYVKHFLPTKDIDVLKVILLCMTQNNFPFQLWMFLDFQRRRLDKKLQYEP